MTRRLAVLAFTVVLAGAGLRAQEQETPRPANRDPFPTVRVGDLTVVPGVRLKGDLVAAGSERGDGDDHVDIQQRRVALRGEYGRRVSFEISHELGDHTPWRDVYLDYRFDDSARLRAGHFKVPFSLEATTGGGNLDFVQRSHVASAIGGVRQVGLMAHGRLWRRRIEYEAGAFEKDGQPDQDEPGAARLGSTVAGRVLVVPMARTQGAWRTLQVGIAATRAIAEEGISSHNWRDSVEALADAPTDLWVNGASTRMAVESRWRVGSVGLAAEYVRSVEERRGQGIRDEDLSPLRSDGWYVGGSWLLTGERKTNNIQPRRSLVNGGPGAFEIAGRWEALTVGNGEGGFQPRQNPRADDVARRGVRGWTAGVNWYLHRWVKLQLNVVRDELTGAWVEPGITAPARTSRTLRVQFEL